MPTIARGVSRISATEHTHGPRPNARFRTDIEGLRGVAVLIVVLYHAGLAGVGGGFIGVDVFFVLSGYLITGLLVAEAEGKGRIDLLEFYARRVRRLLPAAALMAVFTIAGGMVILGPVEQATAARSAAAVAAYSSNLWFMISESYFAPQAERNPLLHTWSLAVEEQFYLLWPLLVMLGFRFGRSRRRLAAVMAALSIVSFGGCVWLTLKHPSWAFFSMPARAWEFGVGGIAALLPLGRRRWSAAAGWLGLGAVLAAAMWLHADMLFPGYVVLIPVLGTVLALSAGEGETKRGIGRLLGTPVLQTLGRLSYSWYLWHWPVLVFAAAIAPGLPVAAKALLALAALGMAQLSYTLVEKPIRFHPGLKGGGPYRSLALGLGLTVCGLGSALAWRTIADRWASAPEQRVYTAAREDHSPLYAECMAAFTITTPLECTFGPSSGRTVVLFGDSHAAQWFPAVQRLADAHQWRVVTFIKASCPAPTVPLFNGDLGREEPECAVWRESVLRRIQALAPSAVIVTSAATYVRGSGPDGGYARLSYDEWGSGYRRTLERLTRGGAKVLLLRDPPRAEQDVPVCLSQAAHWGRRGGEACSIDPATGMDPAVFGAETQAAAGLSSVLVADLTDQICNARPCAAEQDGTVLYYDTNHFTATYAATLAPVLAVWLRPLMSN